MTNPSGMTPLRRRPMPGMSTPAPTKPEPVSTSAPDDELRVVTKPATESEPLMNDQSASRRSQDYSATRLVNFRLPVDLHDRYREMVGEVEKRHPRIRRPSLTELIIGLLEEGPANVDEVADLMRRKRASEYTEEARR